MPSLNWIGKAAVEQHHREVPYRLVHCDGALSAGDADAGNLLVQGDNLEALKALLPYYAGKVKCIYIDPPYNTGNEGWAYNDNVNSPEMKSWLGKVVGKEAEDLSRHDKWLCMMYPRLRLLREFLREDGVIAVSIDDDEHANLMMCMYEIFGRSNFVANIVWQKRYVSNNTAQYLSDMHDFIVIFGKNAPLVQVQKIARTEEQESDYKNPDNDPRGPWRAQDLSASKPYSAGMFTIIGPQGDTFDPPPKRYWRMNRTQYEEWLSEGRITFGKTGSGRPMLKRFLTDTQQGLTPNTWWDHKFAGHNKEATLEIKDLFGGASPFDTPKPKRLLTRLLELFTSPGDLILDSFAGSGTTGHAVLDLNKQDGGDRRFILVEMAEDIAKDITSERLRRVINGYDKGGDPAKPVPGLGGGFRYCRLGVPLFNEFGDIDGEVSFPDLAAHVFFAETGAPIPQKAQAGHAYLGKHGDKAVWLLFTPGAEGMPREAMGNVLTPDALAALPPAPEGFDGARVVYAEGCTVSPDRLKAAGVVFKQIPYQIAGV